MADDQPAYEKPVQHQPNVADDPKGQPSPVRGVPVHLTGKPQDDATSLPKAPEALQKQQDQAAAIERGETEKNSDATQKNSDATKPGEEAR
jgi:hypothetical protein